MPQDFPSYTHWHNQASIQQGKEKVIEIEEEKGKEAENTEQDLVLSNVEKREERQSSLSFDYMHDPPAKTNHNKQAESSR